MNHVILLLVFCIAFILEFGAFGMQRATLLMSREAGVSPKIGALLLPKWFPIVWLVRLIKWAVLIYIAFAWSWILAGGLLVVNFILSTFLPIPYSIYIPSFRSRIDEIKANDREAGTALEQMFNMSKFHSSFHH